MNNFQEKTCYKCGAEMRVSKAGKLYCSALCWKGGENSPQEPVQTQNTHRPTTWAQKPNLGGNSKATEHAVRECQNAIMDILDNIMRLENRIKNLEKNTGVATPDELPY